MKGVPNPEAYKAAAAALKRYDGNQSAAARALKIPLPTLRYRVNRAAQLGLMGTEPVLPGFGIKTASAQYGEDGKLEKEWIKQGPVGEKFELPPGHLIKGISAFTDPDGRLIHQWVKTRFEQATTDVAKALRESFKAYKGRAELVRPPRSFDRDLATVYPISDHHLGLYAWAEEAGEDYDLKIGARLLTDTMRALISDAPPSRVGVVLSLGDFFHSDSNENRTRRGNNPLDTDTRHAKILRAGVDLFRLAVELALQKHHIVLVRALPGNHDPYATIALAIGIAAFFDGNPRVRVDASASPFWWWQFGKVLLGATHGDMIKHVDMPGVMAARCPKEWGATEYRYIYLGHVHHKSLGGGEKAGVIWEAFQTLAPRDAWHQSAGYTTGRSMVAITHHRNKGEVMRHTVSVCGPR
jgi:Bacterial regulatory protein, Fis family